MFLDDKEKGSGRSLILAERWISFDEGAVSRQVGKDCQDAEGRTLPTLTQKGAKRVAEKF